MSFEVDYNGPCRIADCRSFNDRKTPVDQLLLHYTGMQTAAAALERLCDASVEASSHYVVDEDGTVHQLVPERLRAWHAGKSLWKGVTDNNSCGVGIEIVNPGHEWGYRPFPEAQMAAVVALCADIVERWSIPPERVLAHSDIAPDRKEDPGELFDWDRLARAGIGHWVTPAPIEDGPSFGPDDEGVPVQALQSLLAWYGYGIEVTGVYDKRTELVVTAFQRHFRPERVDGRADPSTIVTLRALCDGLTTG